jgi:DTW domain-containing protein YfiP
LVNVVQQEKRVNVDLLVILVLKDTRVTMETRVLMVHQVLLEILDVPDLRVILVRRVLEDQLVQRVCRVHPGHLVHLVLLEIPFQSCQTHKLKQAENDDKLELT